MAKASQPPLSIWAVSDGRTGIEAQALGLAEAVARLRPAEVAVKRIAWRWGLGRLPAWLNPGAPDLLTDDSAIAPPWPDIWIAAGRATVPLSRAVRPATYVVQTQDPKVDPAGFDLVIPPLHDGLAGENVFPITGSPNRLTPHRLADDLARWRDRLDALPHPRVALIVGGISKAHDLPAARALQIAHDVAAAIQAAGGSLMLSFTRRTPAPAREAMTAALAHLPGIIWDDQGDNPYFAFLAAADAILVTEDSTNLATDAAATGKPVFTLPLPGGSPKFARFHEDLRTRGVARPFAGAFETWTYPPLSETDRAAAEVLRRYDLRRDPARIARDR